MDGMKIGPVKNYCEKCRSESYDKGVLVLLMGVA